MMGTQEPIQKGCQGLGRVLLPLGGVCPGQAGTRRDGHWGTAGGMLGSVESVLSLQQQ